MVIPQGIRPSQRGERGHTQSLRGCPDSLGGRFGVLHADRLVEKLQLLVTDHVQQDRHAGYLQHTWCLEISNRKLAPGLRWRVLTRKSMNGFHQKLTLANQSVF